MAERAGSSSGANPKLVLIALGVAVFAVVVVNVYIEMIQQRAREESFVAFRLRRALQPGDKLEREALRRVRIPKRFRDAFSAAVKPKNLELELGEPVQRFAPQGSFLTHKILQKPKGSSFDQRIEPGMRAKALPINEETIPGEVRPGMYVDIEAPFPKPGGGVQVLTVMERVKVLAVGNRTIVDEGRGGDDEDQQRYRRITIAVKPKQATLLARIHRAAVGAFELLLRNPTDRKHPRIEEGGINPKVLELVKNG